MVRVYPCVLVLALACSGSPDARPSVPPAGPSPPASSSARITLGAELEGQPAIAGAIHVDSVNAAIAGAGPALAACASDATERGIVLERALVRVTIAHDGSLSEASAEPTPAADPAFAQCAEAALRARRYPTPLGPPIPGFEVPPGEDASRYLIANASATFVFTR